MSAADGDPRPIVSADPSHPIMATEAAAASGDTRRRFAFLLAALAASFLVEGIAPEGDVAQAVVTILLGGTLLLAFWAAEMSTRHLWAAALTVGLGVCAVVIALFTGNGHAVTGAVAVAKALLVALAPAAVVVGVLRSVRRHQAVTPEAVAGALCLYLLAGMFFAFVYGAINSLGGAPFFSNGLEATAARCLYFSFITLTTVGYGDLVARTSLGHTLSAMEALLGQVYLVTVVAVIVSNVVPRKRLH